ncbi:MAG: HAMP domain-containing histidine kinase [Planctomycetes bacterium]|nr:HAMP domain-containing histidine kinase [Planctomycetota bacterium]
MTAAIPDPGLASGDSDDATILDRLVTAWPEAALVTDRSGGVVVANAAARELLGMDPTTRGLALVALVGADVAHALLDVGRDPVERVVGEESGAGSGNGGRSVLRARAASLGDRFVVICISDASGETRLRSHLGLAERLASIGELLSSVAHELNNPLTTVLGYADLLLAEDAPNLPRTEIEHIRSEALRCRRIVGNLLDLARADAVELRPLVLTQVVDKVVEFRGYACNASGIALTAEMDETPVIFGDFHRLVQAVLNLVTNAEDAVRQRTAPRRIVVRTRTEGNKVRVEVDDNGDGVAAAVQPFIFQPFFTTKPRGKGTGLGLSLVRTTVRQHGGEARVEDAPGGGARFILEFPAAGPG